MLQEHSAVDVKRTTRWVAAIVILFLADAAQILLLAPGHTAELFAWPIATQVTSLVLGSAYVAGGYYFARVLVARDWQRVAAGFPPVIVFVWLAAIATALHLDRFTHDGLSFVAWAGIYSIAPVGLPLLYLAQGRTPTGPLLPGRLRIAISGIGGVVALAGLLICALPQSAIDVWPWALTPLTARIVAAVVALFGSLWVSVALSGSATGARIPLEAHAVGLAFLLLAAARGHGEIDWSNPLAPILVAGVAGVLLVDLVVLATKGPGRTLDPGISRVVRRPRRV